jgi:hypothetical protein
MLDFSELSKDGQDFELLVRELLLRAGFIVHWSGKGADGGRDLVCIERRKSYFVPDEKRWLIQCKHNAISGKAVGIGDIDNVVDSCAQHECTGYVLATSTYPSSAVASRLEAITRVGTNPVTATFWDAVKIEQLLSTPRNWPIAQRFFSKSANAESWQIYATEAPNHWVVNYRGYYFHLSNRIGSRHDYHLDSIRNRVKDIEELTLPKHHFIRIRSAYYDDKNGNYTWYLDYMYPNDQRPVISTKRIAHQLGDGYALEDGQVYFFDVKHQSYLQGSDHYDPDHYSYYTDNAHAFSHGLERARDAEGRGEAYESEEELRSALASEASRGYDRFVGALRSVHNLRLLRSENARIEDLTRFNLRKNWSSVIEDIGLETDRFFSALFLIEPKREDEFMKLVSFFPQSVFNHFRLTRVYVFVPSDEGEGSERSSVEDESLFELTLSIHPGAITDMVTGRSLFNDYFSALADAVDAYLSSARAEQPTT